MTTNIISQEVHKSPAISNWRPQWLVDIGHDCQCGITVDDHCFVVLTADVKGQWHSVKHIPHAVAQRIGQLAKRGLLDY